MRGDDIRDDIRRRTETKKDGNRETEGEEMLFRGGNNET